MSTAHSASAMSCQTPELFPRPEREKALRENTRFHLTGGRNDGDTGCALTIDEGKHDIVVIRRPDRIGLVILIKIWEQVYKRIRGLVCEQFIALASSNIEHIEFEQQCRAG